MLTPQEVSSQTFEKAMRGYNMNAVDEFLDELTQDYTTLYKENAALKAKLKVMVDKVEEYRSTEDSMRSALAAAQRMADNMVTDAEKKKDDLLKNVEEVAKQRKLELRNQIAAEEKRLEEAKEASARFVKEATALCQNTLGTLGEIGEKEIVTEVSIPDDGGEKEISKEIEEKVFQPFHVEDAPVEEATSVVKADAEEEADFESPFKEEEEAEEDYSKLSFGSNTFDDDFAVTQKIDLDSLKFGSGYKDDKK